MAKALDLSKLRSLLECSVCLEQYENPKMLKCTHEFCKLCLEDLVEFNQDGSASIRCPMRCKVETILTKSEVVNDLAASYIAKNILETFTGDCKPISEKQMPVCSFNEDCSNPVSLYCSCGICMCEKCHTIHASKESDHRKVTLAFNKRKEEVVAICDEHVSQYTHVCQCDDRPLLCMYCMHRKREHKKHAENTISREAELIGEELEVDRTFQVNRMEQLKETTEDEILDCKSRLVEALRQRKAKCVQQYNEFLDSEEERLLRKFDDVAGLKVASIQGQQKELSVFFKEKARSCDAQLALTRKEILEKVKDDIFANTLVTTNVSLSNILGFLSQQPLGEININEYKKVEGSLFTFSHKFEGNDVENSSKSSIDCHDEVVADTPKHAEEQAANETDSKPSYEAADALKAKGNEHFRRSLYEEAVKCYSEAIELRPDESVYYQNRAAANEKLSCWKAVVEDCSKAIELNPRYCKALHRRARAYLALSDIWPYLKDVTAACFLEDFSNVEGIEFQTKIAMEYIEYGLVEEAQMSGPNQISSYQMNSTIESYESAGLLMIRVTEDKADSLYMQVMASMEKHDYASVFELCTKEISVNGKHRYRASLLRGILNGAMEDWDAALKDFSGIAVHYEQSHDKEPLRGLVIDALCRISYYQMTKGDMPSAFEHIDWALKIDPMSPVAMSCKARILKDCGKREEGLSILRKAISLDNSSSMPFTLLASWISSDDPREAGRLYDEIVRRFPQSTYGLREYASFLISVGRRDEALQKLDKALVLDPNDADTYCIRSMVFTLDEAEEKLAALLKAIEVDDKCYTAQTMFGGLMMACGNYKLAAKGYGTAYPLVPKLRKGYLSHVCRSFVEASLHWKVLEQYPDLQHRCDIGYERIFGSPGKDSPVIESGGGGG